MPNNVVHFEIMYNTLCKVRVLHITRGKINSGFYRVGECHEGSTFWKPRHGSIDCVWRALWCKALYPSITHAVMHLYLNKYNMLNKGHIWKHVKPNTILYACTTYVCKVRYMDFKWLLFSVSPILLEYENACLVQDV